MTRIHWLLISAATTLLASGSQARADGFVIGGGGLAHDCYVAARDGRATDTSLRLCTLALEQGGMDQRDVAGTHINRGALQLKRRAYGPALADFDLAVQAAPELGEGHVNRGAALLGLHRFAEARAAIDLGLTKGASEPEKAYFNRATARELEGDVDGAYGDYLKASELAPAWEAPKAELKRFHVEPR